MTVDIGYAWEKLHLAIHTLAAEGDLRSRLHDVYCSHLHGFDPDKDLPGEVREEFVAVREALSRAATWGKNEGRAMASARALADTEARALADRIVSMYETVVRLKVLEELREDQPGKPSAN
jgi:hypothetical protein